MRWPDLAQRGEHLVVEKRLVLVLSLLFALGQVGCRSPQPVSLTLAGPEDLGLDWQECAISEDFSWKQVETCFGHSMPLWSESDTANFAARVGMDGMQLAIGQDVYEVKVRATLLLKEQHTLYKNGRAVRSLSVEFTTYSPSVSLQNVGGKAVWEFSDGNTVRVIGDGVDLCQLYGLDKAYRPYALDDRLIFVGQEEDKYFVVYDGSRLAPDFDEIAIAYCCEPIAWSVQYGQGKYLFWGRRGGQWYVVEVSTFAG